MLERIQKVAESLSNSSVGDGINKVGMAGIGSGAGLGAATGFDFSSLMSYMPATWPEWAAFFSILGVLSMMLKNVITTLVDAYIKLRTSRNGRTND